MKGARLATTISGLWDLEAWEAWRGGELDAYPHGPNSAGRVAITSQGGLALFLQRRDWPLAEKGVKASLDRFFALAGDWTIVDGALSVLVTFANEPALIGTILVMDVECARRRLLLSPRSDFEGRDSPRNHRLSFRKAKAGEGRA